MAGFRLSKAVLSVALFNSGRYVRRMMGCRLVFKKELCTGTWVMIVVVTFG